jgi:hypothetical protein
MHWIYGAPGHPLGGLCGLPPLAHISLLMRCKPLECKHYPKRVAVMLHTC